MPVFLFFIPKVGTVPPTGYSGQFDQKSSYVYKSFMIKMPIIIGGQNAERKLYDEKALFLLSFWHFSHFYYHFILSDKYILLQFLHTEPSAV